MERTVSSKEEAVWKRAAAVVVGIGSVNGEGAEKEGGGG